MTDLCAQSRPLSPGRRALFSIPLLGRIARDIAQDVDSVFFAGVVQVTLLVRAVQTWGLAKRVGSALAFVPVMFILLIWMTLP